MSKSIALYRVNWYDVFVRHDGDWQWLAE